MQPRADLLIRKARVIDPATGRDEIADLLVEGGRLSRIGASLDAPGAELFDADSLWLLPGLVDTCVRLPEPASGRAGSIASETRAAASGGITHMAALPDTDPVADNPAVVRLIRERAIKAGFARVMPIAALTQGLAGSQLSEMQTLKEMGCIAVGNAGHRVQDALVLKRCLEYAATFDLLVIFRPQDGALSAGGCTHEGPVASRLGLPGIPAVAETVDLARALLLVEATGVRAHFHQLSCAASVELLRDARARGLPVTADVSVHHLLLDEYAIEHFNSLCHIDPPLRRREDRAALLAAVADGTIDAICSQHTPLNSSAKLAPFPATKPGISGLDTLLSLTLKLVEEQKLPLMRALDALTQAPARCLGLPVGNLENGRLASLCVVDGKARRVPEDDWLSAGKNSPWLSESLPGAVRLTVCEGKVTWLSD
jgi:dihydroorotase